MPKSQNQKPKQWIEHRYFRTYAIAARLATIASEPFAYLHDLEELTVEDGVLDFIQNWKKDTLVHKFARWVADSMFLDDTDGPYVSLHVRGDDELEVHRYLPVDVALHAYGLSDKAFEVPPPDGEFVREGPNKSRWQESVKVANACYEYFTENLRLSQEYEDLVNRIAEEVFHIVFLNRKCMAGLNGYIAMHVTELDPDACVEFPEKARLLVAAGGRLKRRGPPRWARRAVFFRDRGRCVTCGVDLSWLIDSLAKQHFDHMIPLARGGLNDVTNLQLLCEPCNLRKSQRKVSPSDKYRRWYETDR
jgi:hypothetical protein